MTKSITIRDIVGPYCGSRKEGNEIFSELIESWDEFDHIIINFEGVEITTLSFFNAAISPLIEKYDLTAIRHKLQFDNIDNSSKVFLNKSIKFALEQLNRSASSEQ